MKKINKLLINPDKLLKDDELIILKGGYDDCYCMCYSRGPIPQPMGLMGAMNQAECTEFCGEMGWDGVWNCI